MIDKLKSAIAAMAEKAVAAHSSSEAMQYAQAACNLANALVTAKHASKDTTV